MGEITDITQQQKRENRFSVYVDGKYKFSLARDQLVQLGLRVGQELSDQDIERLKDSSSFGKLRDLTYKWLSIRPRSAYEIEQYLGRKTEDEKLRVKMTEELESYNYIDDEKFAKAWVSGRTAIKPMSSYRIRQELMKKRVPKEVIDDALASAELDDLAAVKSVIEKRGHRYDDRQKLMAYLARQGYSYDTIKQALSELDS